MVAAPAPTPVMTPVDGTTVARAVLLLDHVPPETVLVKVVVTPEQTVVAPVMVDGVTFTVNGNVALQVMPELVIE